ncbi:DUF4256 domain-containing protein [Flavobacterium orientale]|nr:DUF4256 domain-containing protein [Flavobacterium orientale]
MQAFLKLLEKRFELHRHRHPRVEWEAVALRLQAAPEKVGVLYQMEATGGEPDVIGFSDSTGAFVFCDCAAESPKGRRSLCYDDTALASRKEYKPQGSVVGRCEELGIELLTEQEYSALQEVGPFDLKTSSWLATPPTIREQGGAIFGDQRYGRVFIYHNGAESYYAARGFRGKLWV